MRSSGSRAAPSGCWPGRTIDPAEAWRDAALVTTSPAVNPDYPTTEPRLRAALAELRAARAAGDPTAPAIVSEPDLVLRLCPAPTIGISGTKGKTTTSALAHALLAADPGHRAILGGNIGRPLVERLPELRPDDRVVIELSELQLPTLSRGTTVAVFTNVTSDHLDRHGSLEAYRAVKRRFAAQVDPGRGARPQPGRPGGGRLRRAGRRPGRPIPADSAASRRPRHRRRLDRGGRRRAPGTGRGRTGHERFPTAGSCRSPSCSLPGRHNQSNALAAIAVALLFGVSTDAIRAAAGRFVGVEHRLESVAVIAGIRYVNDSQGTQPDAVVAALRAFDPPIVLIAGGRDKGVDLGELGPVVAERVAAAILIGESGPDLEARFSAAGLARTERAATLEAAVRRAAAIAAELRDEPGRDGRSGEPVHPTVLLSPAAASFDMFIDYEARGRAFKAAVASLAEESSR